MTFTLLTNAILGAVVLVALIAGICTINGTPLSLRLRKCARRLSLARPRLAEPQKSEKPPAGIELGL